jgi:thiol-disulfide isomerase/thioredoxin
MYSLYSQSFTWIYDEAKEYDIPVGKGVYDELRKGMFYSEMEEYYTLYTPDESIIQQLNQKLKNIVTQNNLEIDIYFGAWCGDSKEHVPALMKIVDTLSVINKNKVVLIACDRDKNVEFMDISDAQIEFVPTFIFLINGKEIGRIVETPTRSLEEDFLYLLQDFENLKN